MYTISEKTAAYHTDNGSPVWGRDWAESARFDDVVKWCNDNNNTTASINARVFGIDNLKPVPVRVIQAALDCCKNHEEPATKENVLYWVSLSD